MYRNLLERATNVIHEGLIIVDAQAVGQPTIYVNNAFLRITGFQKDEVIGQNCRFLQRGDLQPEVELIKEALQQERPVRVLLRNYKKDGTLFWNDLSISPIIEDGKTTYFVGVVSDVTHQKAVNEKRHLLEEHAQHTHKLEALGTLASGIAHDVNNSLVPISTLGRLLLAKADKGTEEHEFLSEILRAADRIGNLTTQIVAFSRRSAETLSTLSLIDEVEQTLSFFRTTSGQRIPVTSIYHARPNILAERGRLHQVVLNLLTNAMHALQEVSSPQLSVEIDVVGRPKSAPLLVRGKYAALTVIDNGTGMTSETRDRALDPFFTTKGPDEGSGMGLSIVHGIVTSAGGAVRIESAPDAGTRITIFWPAI